MIRPTKGPDAARRAAGAAGRLRGRLWHGENISRDRRALLGCWIQPAAAFRDLEAPARKTVHFGGPLRGEAKVDLHPGARFGFYQILLAPRSRGMRGASRATTPSYGGTAIKVLRRFLSQPIPNGSGASSGRRRCWRR